MNKSWMWKQRSYREQFEAGESGAAGGAAAAETQEQAGEHAEAEQGEGAASEQQQGAEAGVEEAGESDEVVITIGDEPAPAANDEETQQAPQWVKDLRREHREVLRQKRELEKKLAEKEATSAPAAVQVGEKPTLESCEYDENRYETALTSWHERKRQADDQAAKQRKEQEDAQAAWQERLTSYQTAKGALKVPDFEDAEAVVLAALNQTQHGIIVHGANDPAALTYAIGKNPAKLKELAAIKDPVKYAFAVARLETQMKVTHRKAAPAPERKVGGSAAGATSMDNTLERLRAEADRTGDRSKVTAYLRQQQKAA